MSNENTEASADIKATGEVGDIPVPKQEAIELDRPIYKPITEASRAQIPLTILHADSTESYQALIDTARVEGTSSKQGKQWYLAIERAYVEGLCHTDYGRTAVLSGNWKQRIKADDGTVIGTKNVGMGDISSDGKLAGAAAVQRFRSLMGTGATRRYPLWASGFWITLRAPDEIDLLNLEEAIAQEKSDIGAKSAGLALSISTFYIVRNVANLIVSSIFSTNISDEAYNQSDVLKYIKITDFLGLVQFFTALIYPNGYAFQIPCAAGNGCVHIDEGVLDLNSMLVHKHSAITPEQRQDMASYTQKRSLKQIADYQEKYHNRKSIPIKLDGQDAAMNLKVPSVAEYCESGDRIVDEIIDAVNRAVSENTSIEQKERMIRSTYNLGAAREYAHVIESFVTPPRELGNGQFTDPETTDDPVTVNAILKELSIRTDITRGIIKECNSFLERATYTHVVLTKHTCTKCGKMASESEDGSAGITIPFDPIAGFFSLRDRRLQRAIRTYPNE